MSDHPSTITARIKQRARELGFDAVGCCAATRGLGFERFQEWLTAGYAGTMHYLPARTAAYQDPSSILNGVRSLILLTANYATCEPEPRAVDEGRVSRYAWGADDYHDVVHNRLKQLAAFITGELPAARVRGVVDTAPLLEREYAQLAGLGWIGKNTLLIQRDSGSWFFIAALLTDIELDYDEPFATDHCGTCRACLDACPTAAFPQAYVLDATRCISYLTIELRETVPQNLRESMGDWLFGCDICQDVCPWNRKAPQATIASFQPQQDLNPVDLPALFELDDQKFRERFRNTPLWRPKRRGILRNAAIALGNQPSTDRSRAALVRGLNDHEALVRGACAWALGQAANTEAQQALSERLEIETDETVRQEIHVALEALV